LAFENFFLHAFIARSVATRAARKVDHDFAAGFSSGRIEMDVAALQLEAAVHRVQRVMQGEIDFGLGRIQLERALSERQPG
jgi:hypothetical protein